MKLRAAFALRGVILPTVVLGLGWMLPNSAFATGGDDVPAPSALPFYLGRLPAKSPSEIFLETTPRAPRKPTDFRARLLELATAAQTGSQTPAALAASVDDLLVQARLEPDSVAPLCNLLNDARDLFAAAPPIAGKLAAEYLRWRVEHADPFGLPWENKHPITDAKAPAEEDQITKFVEHLAAEAQRHADDPAQRPLRAHWLYLRAALTGHAYDFLRVAEQFPDSPRAESARFMVARRWFREFRDAYDGATDYGAHPDDKEPQHGMEAAARKAREAFEDYLRRYPTGRFVADAPGWLGAIAYDSGDYLAALDLYLRQADTPGHPEVLKSAGFMCERCLSHLSTGGDQIALDRVAAHPKLAMSLVYLLVHSPESDNYDGKYDAPAEVNKWRHALLPRLAAAVTAHRDAYQTGEWQGRYLAILAQAASGVGDQDKALALCEMNTAELARLDDLAFIRLVALQRKGDLRAAIDAGHDFLARFPDSQLARGVGLRVALALRDDHQAGAAIVALLKLQRGVSQDPDSSPTADSVGIDDPNQYPPSEEGLEASESVLTHDASGAEYNQTAQIIDALLNFAPRAELAAALTDKDLDGTFAIKLRAVLTQRWLAEEENFVHAKEFVAPAAWGGPVATVEQADANARAHPADPVVLQALGDAWAAARGKLVFAPLEVEKERNAVYLAGGDEGSDADALRLENGRALGMVGNLEAALAGRDELYHARAWWLRAADAAPAGSPARAHALWLALRAVPMVAAATPARAADADAPAVSRKLYERLRRECPASREAREFAVYYDFASTTPDFAPDESTGDSLHNPEYEYSDRGAFGLKGDAHASAASPSSEGYLTQVLALRESKFLADPTRLAKEMATLRRSIHADLSSPYDTYLQNCLDDLDDFLKEDRAKLTPAAVRRYVALRIEALAVESWGGGNVSEAVDLKLDTTDDSYGPSDQPLGHGKGVDDKVFNDIRAAYQDPVLAPFKDYLDFLAIAVVANHSITVTVPGQEKDGQTLTYTSRDYPKLAKLTEAFLREHPHSHKREAAMLLYARGVYNASRPRLVQQYVAWPQSGTYASQIVSVPRRVEPFDPTRLGAALNAYDREFPHGRYSADIRNLRGLLAWRTQDWTIALNLTLQTLADKNAPDLQPEAALRLANIFSEGLTDDTERARLVTAIRTQPGAREKLRAYLDVCTGPLSLLKTWLLESSGLFR